MALTRRSPRLSSHAATSKAPTGSTSSTDTVLASAMVHPPGKIRIGVPVLVTWLVLWMGLNFLLLWCVPHGWIVELLLIVWAGFLDQAPFNGKGRPILTFRRGWWWDAIRSYFPLTLHQEEHFDASKRYLFVIHPHGIISFSAWLSFAADSAELSRKNSALDIAMATVNANFYIPFWRDVLLAMGLVDASFQSLTAVLRRGRSVAVVLGGAAEALDAHPNTNDIILDKRKGIVRLALSSGTPLVPVFVFGESDLFYQLPNPKGSVVRRVQESFLSAFRLSPPLIMGRGIMGCPVGILPYARPLHVVTGAPIQMPLIPSPTDEDVTRYQAVYRTALEKLYVDHETRYYEEILPEALRSAKRPVLRIVA